jgi:hypothetical protein
MQMPERRRYQRFTSWLPLRLKFIEGQPEHVSPPLLTQNISKAGVCFPAPMWLEPGQFIEVEVTLLGIGPAGKDVNISATGHIVRAEPGHAPGWYKLAAAFREPPNDDQPGWHNLVTAFD